MEMSPHSNQACAACKHRRMRCNSKCEIGPYFPATKYDDFRKAQRLFGVSNIAKFMSWIDPNERQAAADSILVEANAWKSDPVRGCYGGIKELAAQVEFEERELSVVKQHLEFHKRKVTMKREQDQFYDCLIDPYFASDMHPDELTRNIHSYKSTLVGGAYEENAFDLDHKEAFDEDENSSASLNC